MHNQQRDQTRRRLIEAATEVFAEHGYAGATTRDICTRAKANAAAVNYHFGDKLGLYTEVLRTLVAVERKHDGDAPLTNLPPDQALRQFIESAFRNVGAADSRSQYTRLMVHELARPTAGLEMVVKQFIQPRSDVLGAIVARIIKKPKDSDRTRLCALSVIGQIINYHHSLPVINLLWPKWRLDEPMRREMIEHFTRFSLAALHHLSDSALDPQAPEQRPRRRG